MKPSLFFLVLSLCYSTFSQEKLKLEDIMKGYDFVGHPPKNHFWSWDNQRIYFDWNPNSELESSTYYWQDGFSEPKILPFNEYQDLYLTDELQQNRKIRYYLKDGALFMFQTSTKKHQKIVHSSHAITKIILEPTETGKIETSVYFQQENNLFKYDFNEKSILQVTNFKRGSNPQNLSKDKNFLEQQQVELFKFIKEKDQVNTFKSNKNKQLKEKFPSEYYIDEHEIENIQISPNGNYVVFRLSKYPTNFETSFENHITENGYSKTEKSREKVSISAISKHKLGILNLINDSVTFVDFTKLSDYHKVPAYFILYEPNKINFQREVVMHEVIFDDLGKNALIDIRSQDNKDRWIVNLNVKTGEFDELVHQHDPAWIGGPGISEWNFEKGTLGFMNNQNLIFFQSEESGFSHLYQLDLQTKIKTQLTSGNWEVKTVLYSKKSNLFYITANKSHLGNIEFYHLNPISKELFPICTKNGAFDIKISPDEKKIAVLYSDKTNPWELFVGNNRYKTNLKQITFSQKNEYKNIKWIEPEVITFKAKDQTEIYARLYEAKINKNKAAIIFVHGAGYLQNAHNYWSYYLREFMFHNLLVEKGYTVLDIDYRASEGYGRDFRTGIYRHMGGLDLSDNLDGRKLLIEKYGIDSTRIGIYGGSYGGFITLMALLNEPGKFKCGAALRSVTDWAHYNQEYTSNILNFPETDPDAYRKSSPIYFAENLQDQLLLLHGMLDDNVQFQDIVRLSERFIELGKTNWDLAIYPIEAHGFKEHYSWLDEYRRILDLFKKNLVK